MKRRMAQKMQFLAEDVGAAREPTTAELKSWFEKNSAKFAAAQSRELPSSLFLAGPSRQAARVTMPRSALAKLAGQPQDSKLAASLADPFMFQDYYRDRAPELPRQGVRADSSRLAVAKLRAGLVAGTGRVRSRLAPRVRRHRDSRPRAGVRGGRSGREDRVARRAEGAGVGEGVQRHAREVHGAAAGAARQRNCACTRASAEERDSDFVGRGTAVSGAHVSSAGFVRRCSSPCFLPLQWRVPTRRGRRISRSRRRRPDSSPCSGARRCWPACACRSC